MNVQVQITEEDIRDGHPGDPGLCALARSVERAVPEAEGIEVLRSVVYLKLQGVRFEAALSEEAVQFVKDSDSQMRPVKPLAFELGFDEVTT